MDRLGVLWKAGLPASASSGVEKVTKPWHILVYDDIVYCNIINYRLKIQHHVLESNKW